MAVLPVVGPCPSSAASTRRCHSIYKGFAQCLMALGDSLTESAQKDEDTQEIHTICKSQYSRRTPARSGPVTESVADFLPVAIAARAVGRAGPGEEVRAGRWSGMVVWADEWSVEIGIGRMRSLPP
ncbi:hypothetical protein J4Q44_G00093400 [Coregonus suidteri]|uniref:Neuritin-like protein n=1 Tax=Coregonus suidteri TaxID=861788 RepID=A0AAN8LWT5_9TELE